jgi:CRP-like cAMP-binding protein
MSQPATSIDLQRLTQRINEIADENNRIIGELTSAYKQRLQQVEEAKENQPTVEKRTSIDKALEQIAKIDQIFGAIEKRQDEREEARYKRLKQLEDESIEIGKQMQQFITNQAPK